MTREIVAETKVWLSAHYHMPILYSCRSPVSSPLAALALPTPGPATVQLAMIRTGIELFGLEYVRDSLFGQILGCQPVIRPPEKIALSTHTLKRDKGNEYGIGYRQMAHATGNMVISVQVGANAANDAMTLLRGIGYWGQSDSFAYCIDVSRQPPELSACIRPVRDGESTASHARYFTGYVTELARTSLNWDNIVGESEHSRGAICQRLYIWPLVACEHRSSAQVLRFCSLVQA